MFAVRRVVLGALALALVADVVRAVAVDGVGARRRRRVRVSSSSSAAAAAATNNTPAPTITYLGVTHDVDNFDPRTAGGVALGRAGFWFANFNASSPRTQRPTDDNARASLPSWAGPLVNLHWWNAWQWPWRTFSTDGPCTSAGGFDGRWSPLTLPSGARATSGAIVDPKAAGSENNSINRITLNAHTPRSFVWHVVVDNTALAHDAIGQIRPHAQHGDANVFADEYPRPGAAAFNGVPDVYSWRFDNFVDGDYLKLRLAGTPGVAKHGRRGGASFAGFLFDVVDNRTTTR